MQKLFAMKMAFSMEFDEKRPWDFKGLIHIQIKEYKLSKYTTQ